MEGFFPAPRVRALGYRHRAQGAAVVEQEEVDHRHIPHRDDHGGRVPRLGKLPQRAQIRALPAAALGFIQQRTRPVQPRLIPPHPHAEAARATAAPSRRER